MADIELDNGGIVFTPSKRNEEKLFDADAVIQRIKIALSLKKGSFPYCKNMGVTIPNRTYSTEKDIKTLEMYINEAIYPIWQCRAKVLSLDEETMTAVIKIYFCDESYEREVKLCGKL
ncbi:MAG: hypothetical protein PUE67_08920 [Oscillospiraceae bacterium]|nr:hypothetical protein [Oscillospiraceae bacterium]